MSTVEMNASILLQEQGLFFHVVILCSYSKIHSSHIKGLTSFFLHPIVREIFQDAICITPSDLSSYSFTVPLLYVKDK